MDNRYKVTALKWRPKKFEDVVYQSHITTTLANAIKTNRIAHAYLFTGPRGVGKTTVARIFARAVNCLNPQNGEPCDECENCKLALEGRGLDIIEIDGASNRGIDDMRNLQESARYTPSHGKYKIYIIDEIHMITREGFNAFLKTLEEPPEHVIFIGATTEPIKVYPTIISRCQRFDFRRIPLNEIISRLKFIAQQENIKIDDESLLTIAKKGDGSMRDSQSIFDQVISSCGNDITIQKLTEIMNLVPYDYYFKVTDFIKEKNTKGGIELIDFLVTRGYDLHEFLLGLLDHFRNLLHTIIIGDTSTLEVSDEYKKKYITESKYYSEGDILRIMKLLSDLEINYKYFNQPRLRFEMILTQVILLDKIVYIDKLLKEIEELKKKDNLKVLQDKDLNETNSNNSKSNIIIKTVSNYSKINDKKNINEDNNITSLKTDHTKSNSKVSISIEDIKLKWNELLNEIMKQNKINLKTILTSAEIINFENNVLTVACDDEFHTDVIKVNKQYLMEKFKSVFNMIFEINPIVIQNNKKNNNSKNGNKFNHSEHPMIQLLAKELDIEPIL